MATGVLSARSGGARTRRAAAKGAGRIERMITGVPSRFMVPRIVLAVSVLLLLMLSVVMTYSASSIEALNNAKDFHNDPAYFGLRQAIFSLGGIVACVCVALVNYRIHLRWLTVPAWMGSVGLMAMLFLTTYGTKSYGAVRWISLPFGGLTVQPSEFAKIAIILVGVRVFAYYHEARSLPHGALRLLAYAAIGIPMALILFQPDKGTTIICFLTLIIIAYLVGVPRRTLVIWLAVAVVGMLFISLKDDYSRRRFFAAYVPSLDEYGRGYQVLQGIYAFASGGITGVGVGMSRQKYAYLPMAYNDYIFAIVGEELGLVGTLGVVAAFLAIGWAGVQITRYAPDLAGRLLAAGCTSLLLIQFLVNACGVLCIIPLSGKTLPFLSYGGSSVFSCLILVGMLGSVSRASRLPETEFDRQRGEMALVGDEDAQPGRPLLTLVGEPTPRSERPVGARPTASAPLASGGRAPTPRASAARVEGRLHSATSPDGIRARRELEERVGGRVSVDARGRRRIDLGPDAATRLRGR